MTTIRRRGSLIIAAARGHIGGSCSVLNTSLAWMDMCAALCSRNTTTRTMEQRAAMSTAIADKKPAATSSNLSAQPSSSSPPRNDDVASTSGRNEIPPLLVTRRLKELTAADLGAYFSSQIFTAVPESCGGFYCNFYETPGTTQKQRNGNQGTKAELKFSHGRCFMYRQCTHQLIGWLSAQGSRVLAHPAAKTALVTAQALAFERNAKRVAGGGTPAAPAAAAGHSSRKAAASKEHPTAASIGNVKEAAPGLQILLRGPAGAGKSVVVGNLVEWARTSGWLVMYVASAHMLIRGGYFIRRPGSGAQDGLPLYDTPISAKQILLAMVRKHSLQLKELHCQGAGREGKSLEQLALTGMNAGDDAQLAVESCLALRDELLMASAHVPVLFAIDNYNALYWETDYGASPVGASASNGLGEGSSNGSSSAHARRRTLKVEQLPLANGFRMLQQAPAAGHSAVVIGSVGWTQGVSPKVEIPMAGSKAHTVYVPRYSKAEVANTLGYYHQCGVSHEAPSERQVDQILALTNGNGKELRELVPKLTLLKLNMI